MSIAEMVILPAPVEIVMFVPEVNEAKLYPPALPINNWPFEGVWVIPVPPYITPKAVFKAMELNEAEAAEKFPETPKLPVSESVVFLKGV